MTYEIARHGQIEEVQGIESICIMLLQIASDYSSLPDLRKITVDEIEFFYKPLIHGLVKTQQEAMKNR